MKGAGSKNAWALFLLILAGVVLGGFIGTLAKGVPALSWLSYGQSFGIDEPIVLDLGVLVLSRIHISEPTRRNNLSRMPSSA